MAALDLTAVLSLATFAFVATVTPGPNNLMVMSSTMLFGVRKTLPHMLGIQFGFSLLMIAAVFGVGGVLLRYPGAQEFVKWASAVWFLWLGLTYLKEAVKKDTARSDVETSETASSRPLRFIEAALFQIANPKALTLVLSSSGLYVEMVSDVSMRAAIMVAVFVLVGTPCSFAWMMLGRTLRRWMQRESVRRVVNLVMALLIFCVVVVILFHRPSFGETS